MAADRPQRVALVVHPARPIADAVAAVEHFAGEHGLDIVQIHTPDAVERDVAPAGTAEPSDLIVALGGDGTVLAALRASAPVGAPVLGAACGSLGVLTAVGADELAEALGRVSAGEWTARRLPALVVDSADGPQAWALNDFVAVRHGPGQLVADVSVDDELYVRLAGDGVIVATALGSTGYSMAAGGPVLTADPDTFVVTPLAMHAGSAPPLVLPATARLRIALHPGFAGFDIEIDGHTQDVAALDYTLTLAGDKVTLVEFGGLPRRLTRLRERRLISDSARVLARDDRAIAPRTR